MKQLAKAKTECPLCFHDHGFIKCAKALEAGYVVKYDPTKAKVAFDAFDSGQNRKKKTGKQRAASSASAPLPVLPPPPAPQAPPSPPSPPSQTPGEDGDESIVEVAAYQATMSATDSLSDNEEGLAEHGAIPSRSEASTSGSNITKPKSSVAIYPPIPSPLKCAHVSTVPEVTSVGPVPVPEVANVGPVPVLRVANVKPVPDAKIAGPPQHNNATGHPVEPNAAL